SRRLDRGLLGLLGAGSRASRAGRAGGLALAAALLLGVVGVSERATIAPGPAGVSARADRSDLALRVVVAGGHTVVVPGRAIVLVVGGVSSGRGGATVAAWTEAGDGWLGLSVPPRAGSAETPNDRTILFCAPIGCTRQERSSKKRRPGARRHGQPTHFPLMQS